MNPDKNKFEPLVYQETIDLIKSTLVRPNGEPVPDHWSVFTVDKLYEINGYTFRCKYIGETSILFEPVSPVEELDK